MKPKRFILMGLLAGCLIMSFTFSALAQDAASFYKEKALTFVVPYRPGGGYDTYARLIAPVLQEKLGTPVVVRNMHGGGSYKAMNYVYHAKPNGRVILILDSIVATLNQLSHDARAKKINLLDFNWLARVSYEQGVIVLGKKSPYKTIADMKAAKQPIKFSGTKGTAVSIIGCTFLEVAGVSGIVIQGFGGSTPIAMATMRGELDGFGNSASSALKFAEQPELSVLCIVSNKRSPLMPNVPTIGELMTLGTEQQKWVDRLEAVLGMGRSIVTTPGVPQDRVQYLRSTLMSILTDNGFQQNAKKVKCPIDFLSGEDAQKNVINFLKMPESDAKEINHVLLKKYLM